MPQDARVVIEVLVTATADRVWRALRDAQDLRNWHGWDYDGLDAEIREIYLSDQLRADRDQGVVDTGDGRFLLRETSSGTEVSVSRPDPSTEGDEIDEGWVTFVQQLRFYLERHDGEQRSTVRADGERQPGQSALDHVDLGETREIAPDGAYVGQLAGVGISGQVWFRSTRQTGLTVSEWNDALLVVSEGEAPDRGGSLLVSTYALDDASVHRIGAALGAVWSS